MATKSTTSRETKAQELINSGAVSLFVGTGTAEVKGSRGITYIVTKDTGCSCPDRQYRGASCCHELAVRQLCAEYRAWKAKAEQGERIRPSSVLLQALRWPEAPKTAACRECGKSTSQGLCADCFLGQVAA